MARPNTQSPASRLAALLQAIDLCRGTLADAALAHERQPSAETQEQVQQAQEALCAARNQLELFELAREAQGKVVAVQAEEDRVAQLDEIKDRIVALHKQTRAQAERVVATLEALGPEYSQLVAGLAEVRELTAAAARLAGGPNGLRRSMSLQLDGHSILADAIGLAIVGAGFGVVGPSLAPLVTVTTPSGAFHCGSPIGERLDKLQGMRLSAIDLAATCQEQSQHV